MFEESHTQSGIPQPGAPSSDVSSQLPPMSGDGTSLSPDQAAAQKAHRKIAPTAEESAFDFESPPTSAQATTISHSQTTTSPPVVDETMPVSSTTDDKADTEPVIKPTFEDNPSMSSGDSLAFSPLNITLLCTTGARVSLALDQKFIATHSMPVKEPESITVGMLKSVIYAEWQGSQKKAEAQPELLLQKQDSQTAPAHTPNWGAVLASSVTPGPVSPDHIRLIHLGKVLVDTFTLEEYKITSSNAFNVLHLSVRPESMGTKDKNSEGKQTRSKRRASAHAANDRQNASNTRGGERSSAPAGETPARESHARSGCCVIS